jgi:hypothetical protein
MKTRNDFDYTCECGYYTCECGHVAYPMEVDTNECPECLAAMKFRPHGAPAFETDFGSYACTGDTITGTLNGYDLTARLEYDQVRGLDDDDCHNPDQAVTGCTDEQQEKLLEARRAWQNNDWFYCGVVVSVSRNGVLIDDHAAGLWGIECNYPGSDNAYLQEVANDLAAEAIEQAEKERARMVAALA